MQVVPPLGKIINFPSINVFTFYLLPTSPSNTRKLCFMFKTAL